MTNAPKPALPSSTASALKRRARSIASPATKSATMRLRVSPTQKARIEADAKALGVSATQLLLQLHEIASPSIDAGGSR